ncbi:hypothetical protein PGTUg99_000827 [Puccinia graminis f. sp. tritici]|uniref:Uncharacterized protein n=1 Tax=Puccinia graminis f. sp. tritici TaxID=56615 RepID=A0A5B0RJH3_PUCGR|nr:hypothetical protein PGTUg99_000827 [Puccinia graminis f. sp. tritici]
MLSLLCVSHRGSSLLSTITIKTPRLPTGLCTSTSLSFSTPAGSRTTRSLFRMVDSTNEPGSTISISIPEEVEVEVTGKNGVVSGLEHGREGDTNRAEELHLSRYYGAQGVSGPGLGRKTVPKSDPT